MKRFWPKPRTAAHRKEFAVFMGKGPYYDALYDSMYLSRWKRFKRWLSSVPGIRHARAAYFAAKITWKLRNLGDD